METFRNLLIMMLLSSSAVLFAQDHTLEKKKQLMEKEIKQSIYTDTNFKYLIKGEPDWKKVRKHLWKKYKESPDEIVIGAMVRFYQMRKEWTRFADAFLDDLELFDNVDLMTSRIQLGVGVNNTLYNLIFKNVTDKGLLKRAAIQSFKVLNNPNVFKAGISEEQKRETLANYIDTYANLLYKAGKIKAAVNWQTKAVEYSRGNREFANNLANMRKGLPTW